MMNDDRNSEVLDTVYCLSLSYPHNFFFLDGRPFCITFLAFLNPLFHGHSIIRTPEKMAMRIAERKVTTVTRELVGLRVVAGMFLKQCVHEVQWFVE